MRKVNYFPYVDIAVDMYRVRVANMTPLPCHYDNPSPLGDSCMPCLLSLDHPSSGASVGDWNLECTTHIHDVESTFISDIVIIYMQCFSGYICIMDDNIWKVRVQIYVLLNRH